MRLFANGCSFTWGGGILEEGYGLQGTFASISEEHINLRSSLVWPAHLGKLLGCEVTNLSMGCGSNARIVRTTLDHFTAMISAGQDISDHVAVIQWTEPSRYEVFDADVGDWLLIKTDVVIPEVPNDRYVDLQMRLAEHDNNHSTDLFVNMICLASFFDRWGIRYLFTSFLPISLSDGRGSYCIDHINWTAGHPARGMMETVPSDLRYGSGHPTPEGHRCIAEAMRDRMIELGWI